MDSNAELDEFQRSLEDKEEKIERLSDEGFANIMKSSTPDEAKEGLYQVVFCELAFVQNDRELNRIARDTDTMDPGNTAETAKIDTGMIIEAKNDLEELERGNWKKAKDKWIDFHTSWGIPDKKWMERAGLDPNMTFNGVNFVAHNNEDASFDSPNWDEKNDAWTSFVEKQFELIPDETEPYQYPYITELKAKLAQ